jgi:hypothetical protein
MKRNDGSSKGNEASTKRNAASTKHNEPSTKRNTASSKRNEPSTKRNAASTKRNVASTKRNDTWRRCCVSTPAGGVLSNIPGHARRRLQPGVTAADETVVMQTFQFHRSAPLTNAQRQQRWRDKHRGRKRGMQWGPNPPAPMPAPAPASAPAPQGAATLVPQAFYATHVRALPPAQRLQLARLILDDLARARSL